MARTQSLYTRLEDLEANFAARLRSEVAREAKGRTSMFLLRRMTRYFDGRSYRSERVQELESSYKQLLTLKRKLRDPFSPGPVAIVRSFERLIPDGRFPKREERIQFARAQLAKLNAYLETSQSRGLTSA